MNKSIALEFQKEGAVALLLGASVSGFQAVVQNALVNLLTDAGSDLLFATRGTRLFKTALAGGIFNTRSASHACNFAAANTLFFSREYEISETPDKLQDVSMRPISVGINQMDASVSFSSVGGLSISIELPVKP